MDLKVSGCNESEFTCHDGQCIGMDERCDQIIDCRDKSDEARCTLLAIEDGYNMNVAPFTVDKRNRTINRVKVNISTTLMNVIEISEVNHIIELKYSLTIEWYENRVNYHNLKTDNSLNTLSTNEL